MEHIIDTEELEQDLAKIIEDEEQGSEENQEKVEGEVKIPDDDAKQEDMSEADEEEQRRKAKSVKKDDAKQEVKSEADEIERRRMAKSVKKEGRVGSGDGGVQEIILESINASSATANRLALLESDAHIQFVQETCLTKALQAAFEKEAKDHPKNAIGSPLDPEHSKATAGVAVIAVKGLNFYQLPNPTEDYKDAEKMGRCKIYCVDIAGQTLVCANVYGWSGGVKGSKEAERTDDILAIVRMQFKKMPPGPKLICGDLNAQRGCLPNLEAMLGEEGWTDVGNDSKATRGKPGQYTCHANAGVKKEPHILHHCERIPCTGNQLF